MKFDVPVDLELGYDEGYISILDTGTLYRIRILVIINKPR